MNKIYLILLYLSILLSLSNSFEGIKSMSSVSKLIRMVRKDVVDKALLYLPKRNEVNILQMFTKMAKAKEEFSLDEAESAYLVFSWITKNIKFLYDIGAEDIGEVYNSGNGNCTGISSLFNKMSSYLKLEANTIYGNYKEIGPSAWNHVRINDTYFLIDASFKEKIDEIPIDINDFYFGTNPEIFIRFHFPDESKWQLLSEPFTKEKFDSMSSLSPYFFLLGFKSISPDSNELSEKVILTYDESIKYLEITNIIARIFEDTTFNKCNFSNGKAEINYDLTNKNEILVSIIAVKIKDIDEYIPIVLYHSIEFIIKTDPDDLKAKLQSNTDVENDNILLKKSFRKIKRLEIRKNIRGKN